MTMPEYMQIVEEIHNKIKFREELIYNGIGIFFLRIADLVIIYRLDDGETFNEINKKLENYVSLKILEQLDIVNPNDKIYKIWSVD